MARETELNKEYEWPLRAEDSADLFTLEDLKVLYSMVDAVANNPNQYTLEASKEGHPKFHKDHTPHSAFIRIVDMIAREGERLRLIKFFERTSFEDLPTHINSLDPFGLIARWRLKVGK